MKVSLAIVKQLIGVELPPVDELVARINEQLGGVEEVTDLGAKYKNAVIVKVVSAEKHPDADRLTVCRVDDGGVVNDVERDSDGYVQVVCGAPNVHADMWAVWLPPRATVPASFDDAEPFVLDARKLRGVMSFGMLAAGDELAINSNHDGIIELTERDLPPELEGRGLAVGQDFAELFGLDDTIIEIENKMFTHRPDCFGQLGVAREISAILGGVTAPDEGVVDTRFENPEWYQASPEFESATGLKLETFNDAGEKVPRVMFVAMDNVEIKPSPLWLQCRLVAMGSKAINNVVDATNYVMLMSAQPTHAYDYDKLRGATIGARMAHDGEKLPLLNGKVYELDASDIVIADGEGAIGLGGIMGGGNSEVSAETTRIVLEVATFDMYTVRKTSMRHGVFTDALARFNKGQSPLQNDRVMKCLMNMIQDLSSAEQASAAVDLGTKDWRKEDSLSGEIDVSVTFINDRLGSDLNAAQIGNMLRRANFATVASDDDTGMLHVTAPFWRTDIELPEDIVEEVGRLYGFDALPRELPKRDMTPAPRLARETTMRAVRESLSRAGANEVLSYSFVHERVLKNAGQDASEAFRLSNALSPDLQFYRLSILPSLLDKVHTNIKLGYDEFVLFEIGKTHNKTQHATDGEDGLPSEPERVEAVYASRKDHDGAAYFHMRRLVEQLARDLGCGITFRPIVDRISDAYAAPFDQNRSAIVETRQGERLGIVGELTMSARKNFKLPDYSAAISLDFAALIECMQVRGNSYQPLSRFPSTSQDISLRAPASLEYGTLYHTVWNAFAERADSLEIDIEPISIYQAEDDPTVKTTTFHIVFTGFDRTLTDDDIKPIMDHVASVALAAHQIERV